MKLHRITKIKKQKKQIKKLKMKNPRRDAENQNLQRANKY